VPPPGIDVGAARPRGATPKGQEPPAKVANGKQEDEDEKQRQPALFHKTKMCKFNQLGMCTRGEMCRFAHGKMDMNQLPDLSRTKLCKELINTGQCSDPTCKFAHTRHELRRHPFVPAGERDHSGPGTKFRGAAAPDAALGQDAAQLQANANVLCSDLAKVLHKMRQTGQVGSPALYADLAHVLKDFHDSDLVDAWMQQNQEGGGYGSPQFDGVAGGFGEKDMAYAFAQNHQNLVGAAYMSPSGYHGAGMDGVAEMEQLAASAIWGQDSYYETLFDERAAAEQPSRELSTMYAPTMSSLDGEPMYAPTMSSLDVLPPLDVA